MNERERRALIRLVKFAGFGVLGAVLTELLRQLLMPNAPPIDARALLAVGIGALLAAFQKWGSWDTASGYGDTPQPDPDPHWPKG